MLRVGGLGTTVKALRMHKPIVVTGPLLLDQRFWGNVIAKKGVGPPPCFLADFVRRAHIDRHTPERKHANAHMHGHARPAHAATRREVHNARAPSHPRGRARSARGRGGARGHIRVDAGRRNESSEHRCAEGIQTPAPGLVFGFARASAKRARAVVAYAHLLSHVSLHHCCQIDTVS
eukprot:1442662-Pleurochrysis_carterae.AAC.1